MRRPKGLAIAGGLFIVVVATIFALVGYSPSRRAAAVPGTPSPSSAATSPTPAAASPMPSLAPSATRRSTPFADCSIPPGSRATRTEPLADNFRIVVGVPDGWTRKPVGATETQLLILGAPSSYQHLPTTIEVLSLIGYFTNQSPRELASMYYGPSAHPDVPSIELVGTVSDCQVQGVAAAAFEYVQGDRSGYLVLFLHDNYLYGVRLEGLRSVDPLAIRDAKQVLGSITWTVTTPPAR
jgi:hypothetical protein